MTRSDWRKVKGKDLWYRNGNTGKIYINKTKFGYSVYYYYEYGLRVEQGIKAAFKAKDEALNYAKRFMRKH